MNPPFSLTVRVRTMTWEADGVLSVELVAPDGATLPGFEAGAHIDLQLPVPGAAGGMLPRSYSLCNDPRESHRYVVGVGRDRASRGGSRWVHEQLRPGALLQISAPLNHFRLNESAPAFALIAGGIGITPILAMARRLHALGKPVRALVAARSREAAAFVAEMRALVPGVQLHLDSEAGAPPDLAGWLAALPRDTGVYCCGPAPMLDTFERACATLGLADAHIERFAAAPAAPGAAAAPAAGFTLVLERRGRDIEVPPGKSVLDALLDAGVDMPYSCMEGVCGTCETRVLDGEIDHRDGVLSAVEKQRGDVMMVCVSTCKGSRLVLDL
jgi:ferredoxin-NADP reductase